MRSFAFVLCFVLIASSSALFAQTEQPAKEVFTKFETLRGEVVDSHGNRIEKCEVSVSMYNTVKIGKYLDKAEYLGQWEAKDPDDQFRFDVEEPMSLKSNPRLVCRVTAEGYLPESKTVFRRSELAKFDGNFGRLTLKRAVKVTGRISMPASAGDEALQQPKISFKLVTESKAQRFQQSAEFSEDGLFEVTLPEDCQMKMVAYSNNAAAISKTVKIEKFDPDNDGQDLGEIQLKEGVPVSGVVLTRNGSPVENQSVYLWQDLDGQVVHATAITDALGEFDLAPRLGKVIVKLNERLDKDGKAANSTGRKLTARAVNLTLRQGEAAKPIEFREAETFLIKGSVSLADGRVPDNVYVALTNDSDNRHEQCDIGKDGTFAFAIPRGLQSTLVIAYNGDDEDTFFVSSLRSESLNQHRDAFVNYKDDTQAFFIKPIEDHIGPLDFVLLKHIPEHSTATEKVFNWILGD